MSTRIPFIAVCLAALSAAPASAQDPTTGLVPEPSLNGKAADDEANAKQDLAKVQGIWAAEGRDPRTGKSLGRIVKYIKGNKEMVVQEGPDGQVVNAHRVEFQVSRLGAVRLFTYFNAEITDGPQKGQKMPPYTYIYRVDDQAFTEVMGMLVGQEKQTPSARQYKRLENAERKGSERRDAKDAKEETPRKEEK
jgi:hypothetical protein